MRTIALALLMLIAASAAPAATVSVTAKLVDRQCSVEDALQQQPLTAKYCTLWLEESTTISGTTYVRAFTAYCPRTTINGVGYASYDTCSDTGTLQIGGSYAFSGHLRSRSEAVDRRGQFIVTGVQY